MDIRSRWRRESVVLCVSVWSPRPADDWLSQPGVVANSSRGQLSRENGIFPVPVRAREFALASYIRSFCPASARLFSTPRLVLMLITEVLYPFPLSAIVSIGTVMRHWTSPEFIRYRWRSLPPRTRRYKANVL